MSIAMARTGNATAVLRHDPDHPPDEKDQMEFRLTYEGLLLASTTDSPRAKHKHEIRKRLHPQLKRLWEVTDTFRHLQDRHPVTGELVGREESLAARFRCGDYRLVPLVTIDFPLLCSVEILFLRPDPPGELIRSGDIDNRLKVLFDALRIPVDVKELGGLTPDEGEDPFYCLLQDDRLIANLSITTAMMLEPLRGSTTPPSPNDVRLVITVNVQPIGGAFGGLSFI
jgi:hypothetical protein